MNILTYNLIAIISGEAFVSAIIWLICIGLIFWLFWWLISYIGLPEPFNKVARVILAVAAVLILINILLGMAGHPIIKW